MGTEVSIESLVYEARAKFEAVSVDRSINFEREAGFAIQVLMGSDFAMRTALMNQQSVINAVTNVSAIGLSLNPAKKQAYLVPRDGKICLDVSYMGLLDLAIASGSIMWGQAELVYSEDKFTLHGVDEKPTHERQPFAKERGEVVGVYVVVKTHSGDFLTTTMTIDECLAIRDRSQAWKSFQAGKARSAGPWGSDQGEMVKKTVIKRAYKLWPKTDRMDHAIHQLNTEAGEGFDAIDNDPVSQPRNLGLTPARYKVIRAVAGTALQKFNENDEWGAWESVEWIEDEDEKNALWSILQPHSSLRACIKKYSNEKHAKQLVIDAKPAEAPPPSTT